MFDNSNNAKKLLFSKNGVLVKDNAVYSKHYNERAVNGIKKITKIGHPF